MCCTTPKTWTVTIGLLYHKKPAISTSQCQLQLSIRVLIISWHNWYVDCLDSSTLPPAIFRFAIQPLFVESLSKTREFRKNEVLFQSDSTNIGPIAKLYPGGKRAGKTDQSTYGSCHDTIKTQLFNPSNSCRNRKMESQSGFNPAKTCGFFSLSG